MRYSRAAHCRLNRLYRAGQRVLDASSPKPIAPSLPRRPPAPCREPRKLDPNLALRCSQCREVAAQIAGAVLPIVALLNGRPIRQRRYISHWNGDVDWAGLAADGFDSPTSSPTKTPAKTQRGAVTPQAARQREFSRLSLYVCHCETTAKPALQSYSYALVPPNTAIVLVGKPDGVPDTIVTLWASGLAGRPIMAYYESIPHSLMPAIQHLPRILPKYPPTPVCHLRTEFPTPTETRRSDHIGSQVK